MTPEEKYQAEVAQSQVDHHKPTAGAMTSHIIANLMIQQNKLRQTQAYLLGPLAIFVSARYPKILAEESALVIRLNQILRTDNEAIPTTTTEFTEYAMLTEDGATKYQSAENQLAETAQDFATQRLFVTRGIKLAETEEKYALATSLKEFDGWLKNEILEFQRVLGHDVEKETEE